MPEGETTPGTATVCDMDAPDYSDTAGRAVLETIRGYRDAGLRVAVGMDVRDRGVLTYDDDEDFLSTLPSALAADVRRTWGGARTPDLGGSLSTGQMGDAVLAGLA